VHVQLNAAVRIEIVPEGALHIGEDGSVAVAWNALTHAHRPLDTSTKPGPRSGPGHTIGAVSRGRAVGVLPHRNVGRIGVHGRRRVDTFTVLRSTVEHRRIEVNGSHAPGQQ
jgi:hypothetical protein